MIKILEKQKFGSNPLENRQTDHYTLEYVSSFVEKWDELINWEARTESEEGFFIRILKERGAESVLDVATGTGYHSVQLLKSGFHVTSVDGSPAMLSKAFENAHRQGYILRAIQTDWRCLNRNVHDQYDAIICLGNSFTHLFEENDRRKVLAEFYATLRHDGVLILDQRNYDAILDIGYNSKHIYYYCGENVKVEPEYIDEGLARFKYGFPDGSTFFLNMYPLRKNYVRRLIREVGFQQIKTYGDFQETYREEDADFLVHVAEKEYNYEV